MNIAIYPASPEALKRMPPGYDPDKADLVPNPVDVNDRSKYPFKRMKVGHSFAVPFEAEVDKQFDRLRVRVSQASSRLECKFSVIKHAECFEVARIK